jgi:hypothetical protein
MPFKKIDEGENFWNLKRCIHPEHNPPHHILLPPGLYEYTCPGCGYTQPIRVPEHKWQSRCDPRDQDWVEL